MGGHGGEAGTDAEKQLRRPTKRVVENRGVKGKRKNKKRKKRQKQKMAVKNYG